MDALDLLKQQHRQVEQLFTRIEQADRSQREQLVLRCCELLIIHDRIEDEHFYPFARQAGIQDLVDHSLDEHSKVRGLIRAILGARQDEARRDDLCRQLQRSVEAHVREEEERLIPRLQSVCSADQLRDLANAMQGTIQRLQQQDVVRSMQEQPPPQP